jgi:leucyl/phenylalanyl-tRNA--protein transferase
MSDQRTTPRKKVPLERLECSYVFPDPSTGQGAEGVVGVGADLAPGTMLTAYHRGIFPWPAPQRGGDLVVWCSPDPRAVYPLEEPPRWHRSLVRAMRKKPFGVTIDKAFARVVALSGDRVEGTWITPRLARAYRALFDLGWAHSLEVWNTETGELAGGIFGVAIGAAFTAESMFHRETDASKVAFASLVERLRGRFAIFDAEIMNPHLASLGCVDVPRREFVARLAEAVRVEPPFPTE